MRHISMFDSPLEKHVLRFYTRVFSIREIEEQRILQWAFGALIFSYFLAFNSWFYEAATTVDAYLSGTYTCWPYFQNCGGLLILRTLPQGYSQPLLYMVLFATLVLATYLVWKGEWVLAHISLLPSFLWHGLVTFVLTVSVGGNYDYYLFFFALILLLMPHKEFFLKSTLVLFYVLSTVAKIHETWVLGTYFSALKTGLPLFPRWSIPLFTNLIIFMEMIGSWFLLSRNPVLQRTALIFFATFHLYSGLLVGYRYPTTVLPMVLILFGPMYRYTPIPSTKRSIAGWCLILTLICVQIVPKILIPGDEKLTLEGNKYGLYMFEANHQCISTTHVLYRDGRTVDTKKESYSARARCDPYRYWFRIKTACDRSPNVARVAWTFDHSINGGPFLRIVDVPDACGLSYMPFAHNTWIKTERDAPQIIGYPVENVYD